ncbi:hypothetical protein [Variovorax boronicumulans]
MTFDDFEDANIASWISTDLFGGWGGEGKRRPQIRQRLEPVGRPRGLDIQSFISRGIRNTIGKLAGNRDLLPQMIDISRQQPRPVGWVSVDASSINQSPATVATAPAAIGRMGALSISSLLAPATRTALGSAGLDRLGSFSRLAAGWDDGAGESLSLDSLGQLDRFFSEAEISPNSLGIFMSQEGNLITNWPDSSHNLIELEFSDLEISAFFEADGNTLVGEIGDKRFLEKIKNTIQ